MIYYFKHNNTHTQTYILVAFIYILKVRLKGSFAPIYGMSMSLSNTYKCTYRTPIKEEI